MDSLDLVSLGHENHQFLWLQVAANLVLINTVCLASPGAQDQVKENLRFFFFTVSFIYFFLSLSLKHLCLCLVFGSELSLVTEKGPELKTKQMQKLNV